MSLCGGMAGFAWCLVVPPHPLPAKHFLAVFPGDLLRYYTTTFPAMVARLRVNWLGHKGEAIARRRATYTS